MKIRQGFVSNSSSSSFCIYGVQIENDDLMKALKLKAAETCCTCGKKVKKSTDDEEEDYDESSHEIINSLFEKTDTALAYHCPWSFENTYIGMNFDEMSIEETRKQFQDRVKANVTEFVLKHFGLDLSDAKFSIHLETYAD